MAVVIVLYQPTSLLPFLNAALICTEVTDLFCTKQVYSRGLLPSEKNATASADATSDTPFVVILSKTLIIRPPCYSSMLL